MHKGYQIFVKKIDDVQDQLNKQSDTLVKLEREMNEVKKELQVIGVYMNGKRKKRSQSGKDVLLKKSSKRKKKFIVMPPNMKYVNKHELSEQE